MTVAPITPSGSITLVVLSPGTYRFLDCLRFGWPLSLTYPFTIPAVTLHGMG